MPNSCYQGGVADPCVAAAFSAHSSEHTVRGWGGAVCCWVVVGNKRTVVVVVSAEEEDLVLISLLLLPEVAESKLKVLMLEVENIIVNISVTPSQLPLLFILLLYM